MILLLIGIALLYLTLIGSLINGFEKIENFHLKDMEPQSTFSIVVPFRDEAKNLPSLLKSISRLNYPKHLFELILVDDESTDGSWDIARNFQQTSDFSISLLRNKRISNSPKKDAITYAISTAKNNWIATTDADCTLPKFWLDSFDEFIQRKHVDFIVAPLTYSEIDSSMARFQLLDLLSLQGSTLGGFGIGRPFLCNGGNLCYKKGLFHLLNGFQGNSEIASGDDIFMLEKAVDNKDINVGYVKSEHAIVKTIPQPSLKSLISQRVRWSAKTSAYGNWYGKIAGLIVLLMNAMLVISVVLTIIGILNWKTLGYLFIIKVGIDFLLIFKTASFFDQKEALKSYWWASLFYPFFSVYVAFLSVFKGYTWKGRSYVR